MHNIEKHVYFSVGEKRFDFLGSRNSGRAALPLWEFDRNDSGIRPSWESPMTLARDRLSLRSDAAHRRRDGLFDSAARSLMIAAGVKES